MDLKVRNKRMVYEAFLLIAISLISLIDGGNPIILIAGVSIIAFIRFCSLVNEMAKLSVYSSKLDENEFMERKMNLVMSSLVLLSMGPLLMIILFFV